MNQQQGPKNRSSTLFILLVGCGGLLMFGTAVGGILAAIAVPAFLRYTKKSKSSEALIMTRRISDRAREAFTRGCEPLEALPEHAPLPVDGDKVTPSSSEIAAKWRDFGVDVDQPMYFTYSLTPAGDGEYVVRARADFQAGGPVHTVEQRLLADSESCEVVITPSMTINEFD